jgi:hypothetical protein
LWTNCKFSSGLNNWQLKFIYDACQVACRYQPSPIGVNVSPSLRIIGYATLMGPPQALYLHRSAQGTRSELDGLPLWLVLFTEFLVRATIFTLGVFFVGEWMGAEIFLLYRVTYFAIAMAVSGAVHTVIYYLTMGVGAKYWQFSTMQRLYRLGRNLTYSVAPALVAALATLVWQDLRYIPLFEGDTVWRISAAVWGLFMLLGVCEAMFVKRIPTGLERDAALLESRH